MSEYNTRYSVYRYNSEDTDYNGVVLLRVQVLPRVSAD